MIEVSYLFHFWMNLMIHLKACGDRNTIRLERKSKYQKVEYLEMVTWLLAIIIISFKV